MKVRNTYTGSGNITNWSEAVDDLCVSPRVLDTFSQDRDEASNLSRHCVMVYLYKEHRMANASDYM